MSKFESSQKEQKNQLKNLENKRTYESKIFYEENTKINFINKFFIAIGWDVYNDSGIAPQYKYIEFEDIILVGGKPKAPDYCFRIGNVLTIFQLN